MKTIFLKVALAVLLVLSLGGCSGGSGELEAENERLRAELETANESLKAVDSRLEELESKLDTPKDEPAERPIEKPAKSPAEKAEKDSAEESAAVSVQSEIVPPESNPRELVTGEWFFQDFHEEEMNNWIQSLVFNSDGSGRIIRTFYLPKDLNASNYSTPAPVNEATLGFSWSLSGDILTTVYEGDGGVVEYAFWPEQQQLIIKSEMGKPLKNERIYVRSKPPIPEEYTESSVIHGNIQAQENALMRKFFGCWYFDLLIWTFNEDGSGVIDIPELAGQPASTRKFTYSVSLVEGDHADMMITMEWQDSETTSYFLVTENEDSSLVLKGIGGSDTIRLTRTFESSNCPITQAIIAQEVSVLTGSIVYDILPSELQS